MGQVFRFSTDLITVSCANMKDSGIEMLSMERGLQLIQISLFSLENSRKESSMGSEDMFGAMVTLMKGVGRIIRWKELVFSDILEIFLLKVNSLKTHLTNLGNFKNNYFHMGGDVYVNPFQTRE